LKKKGRHFGRKSEGKIVVSFNENTQGYATRRAFNHIQIRIRRREFVRPNTVRVVEKRRILKCAQWYGHHRGAITIRIAFYDC
jgi:hypothetical protein